MCHHGRRKRGVCRGSDTPTIYVGDIDMHIPLEKPNTNCINININYHANCMQHILRCWERQSDGSEYKKTLWRPDLRPNPAGGAYSTPANPLVGGRGWLSPPQEPYPPLSALRTSPLLPPCYLCTGDRQRNLLIYDRYDYRLVIHAISS